MIKISRIFVVLSTLLIITNAAEENSNIDDKIIIPTPIFVHKIEDVSLNNSSVELDNNEEKLPKPQESSNLTEKIELEYIHPTTLNPVQYIKLDLDGVENHRLRKEIKSHYSTRSLDAEHRQIKNGNQRVNGGVRTRNRQSNNNAGVKNQHNYKNLQRQANYNDDEYDDDDLDIDDLRLDDIDDIDEDEVHDDIGDDDFMVTGEPFELGRRNNFDDNYEDDDSLGRQARQAEPSTKRNICRYGNVLVYMRGSCGEGSSEVNLINLHNDNAPANKPLQIIEPLPNIDAENRQQRKQQKKRQQQKKQQKLKQQKLKQQKRRRQELQNKNRPNNNVGNNRGKPSPQRVAYRKQQKRKQIMQQQTDQIRKRLRNQHKRMNRNQRQKNKNRNRKNRNSQREGNRNKRRGVRYYKGKRRYRNKERKGNGHGNGGTTRRKNNRRYNEY